MNEDTNIKPEIVIDKSRDDEILNKFVKDKRKFLNFISMDKSRDVIDYLWQRFPILQDKKYSNGMRLYWLSVGMEDFPICAHTDEGMHKNTTNRCRINGYATEYCCSSCAAKGRIKKAEQTKLERYGDRYWKNPEKIAKTNIERYGVANPFQSKKLMKNAKKKRKDNNDQIMKKAWATRKANSTEKYGQFNYSDKMFLNWLDSSLIENFEVRSYSYEEKMFLRSKERSYRKLLNNKFKPSFTVDEWLKCENPWKQELEWICPEGHHFKSTFKTHYAEHLRCPICDPYLDVGKSIKEKEMQAFINTLIEHPDSDRNTRDIIHPLELDDYVKDKNVAFEFDGLYTHSDMFKSETYHARKTGMCDKIGIQLVHIFEDEWDNYREICESMIADTLGMNEHIDAEDLNIRKIRPDEAKKFILDNSFTHFCYSEKDEISYGLYDENELVFACIVRHLKANKYEMIAYAQKCKMHIINALDKCLTALIKDVKPSYVKCCLDRRFFNIRTLDDCKSFTSHHLTRSNFYYAQYVSIEKFKPEEVTDQLLKSLKKYDPLKSNEQNLRENYFAKIYDVGQIIVVWKK